jgi:hypothetical protein
MKYYDVMKFEIMKKSINVQKYIKELLKHLTK